VSGSHRLAALPEVPTLGELGFAGMEDYVWIGLFAPAGTSQETMQKLNGAVLKVVQAPEIRARLVALGFEPSAVPLRDTEQYVRDEIAKWARVVRDTGAKAD